MKRVLCPKLPDSGQTLELPPDEARHALQVLRLREGEKVEVLDGHGRSIIGILHAGPNKTAFVEYHSAKEDESGQSDVLPITLELSILKGSAMEWAVEKAVELGVRKLVPIVSAHTVVQIDRKGPDAFRDRWQKIADQALKQCGRKEALVIDPPRSLEERLTHSPQSDTEPRIWCDEADRTRTPFFMDYLSDTPGILAMRILVGPEGGWSENERTLLMRTTQPVSLGPLVLRAETAALQSVSLANGYFRVRLLDNSTPKKES